MSSKRLQTSDACKLSQNIFKLQEITFKTLEIDKICAQLNKINDNLRSAISFFDYHISLIHLRTAILKLSKEWVDARL